jgi:hypothetical protein
VAFRKYKFVGFFWALVYMSAVAGGRRKRKSIFRVTDKDIIRLISDKKPAI